MAEGETKVPVTEQPTSAAAIPAASLMQAWRPFDTLRREVDRLFDDFTLNPRSGCRCGGPPLTSSRSGLRIRGSRSRR